MAVGAGIWLVLLGYAISWAGWQNMGITYKAQPDGSAQPSATPVSLLGAFTCKAPVPTPPAASSSSSSSSPLPGINPQLAPLPQLQPAPSPAPALQPAPALYPPLPQPDYSSGFLRPAGIFQPSPPAFNPAPSGLDGILARLRDTAGRIWNGLHW